MKKSCRSQAAESDPTPWSDLIGDLLRQLETPHKGLTLTRKKEGLETVLNAVRGDPEVLFDKLKA